METDWITTLSNVVYKCPDNQVTVSIKDIEDLLAFIRKQETSNLALKAQAEGLRRSLLSQASKTITRDINSFKVYG